MNTRSGALRATPAVASKATKVTQARKASKAKSCKADTTNRVQKPAPSRRNARGYVWIDQDSQTVKNETSCTASPDYISDTLIPSRRAIPETPPASQAELEAEYARLRRELRHHRHRPHHSRQRRSGRDDSEDDSSDSEAGDGRRVSFLHHHACSKTFLSLYVHYPAVNMKYFKQIYWGTFRPSESMRLVHDAWSTTHKGKKDKDDATPEPSNMVQLLRCFDVYTHAICFFAARPHTALQLHEALLRYRVRLMDFSLRYYFDSIRTYHYVFMANRILRGQDDPVAWLSEDYGCKLYLVPKPPKQNHRFLRRKRRLERLLPQRSK